ncbi:MAG: MmcQ/YjbR family DNA-binding protein [Flavobacteriaceae bacterium]|nr:MmcQ/YjbR family DNA-binding protein [Flavobacteriaceae bacterium]
MNIDQIREHCLSKKAVTEEFPFNEDVLVFKVLGKMFLMAPLNQWEIGEASITVKCDPEYTVELRGEYESIFPGPYVSNKHWNTIAIYKREVSPQFIFELIDHSYDMVVKGMSKKMKAELNSYN